MKLLCKIVGIFLCELLHDSIQFRVCRSWADISFQLDPRVIQRPDAWVCTVTLQAFGQVDIPDTKSVIKSKGAWHNTGNPVNIMVKLQRTPNHSAITMKMTLPKLIIQNRNMLATSFSIRWLN